MTIHARIKQRRLAQKMSMETLAGLVGVKSWQTIQQWEKEGGTMPLRKHRPTLCAALQCTVEWLETGNGSPEVKALVADAEQGRYVLAPAEEKLLLMFRQLSGPQQTELMQQVGSILDGNLLLAKKTLKGKLKHAPNEKIEQAYGLPEHAKGSAK